MPEPNEAKPAEATAQQVEKAQEQVRTAISAGATPLEVTLPDGQVFKGATPQELIEKLAAAKTNANEHVKRVEAEAKAAREEAAKATQEMERLKSSLTTAINPQSQGAPTYDHNRFLQLLADDGVKAFEYAKQFDPEYQRLKEQAAMSQNALLTQTFLGRNADFTGNPDDSKAIVDFLETNKLDMTNLTHLEMAYDHLQKRGKLTSKSEPATTPTPPPFVAGGGYAPPSAAELELAQKIANAPDIRTARELLEQAAR